MDEMGDKKRMHTFLKGISVSKISHFKGFCLRLKSLQGERKRNSENAHKKKKISPNGPVFH